MTTSLEHRVTYPDTCVEVRRYGFIEAGGAIGYVLLWDKPDAGGVLSLGMCHLTPEVWTRVQELIRECANPDHQKNPVKPQRFQIGAMTFAPADRFQANDQWDLCIALDPPSRLVVVPLDVARKMFEVEVGLAVALHEPPLPD